MRPRLNRVLFASSGLIPPLGVTGQPPEFEALIYSLMVFVGLRHRPPRPGERRHPARFWLLLLIAGTLTECLAWLNAVTRCEPEPGILHPQLIPDLLLGVGFYSSWAVAWILVRLRYCFTLRQAFLTQGLYGVLVERQGGIFLAGLASLPIGLVLWLFVFLVYGSALGIAYALAGMDANPEGLPRPRRRFVWIAVALAALLFPVSGGWSLIMGGIGLVPPPAPICERPFL